MPKKPIDIVNPAPDDEAVVRTTERKQKRKRKKLTKALMQRVCDELADGKSLNQICRMDDMPSRRAVYYAIQRDDELFDLYAKSRAIAAEILSDEINDVAREPLDSIDPKARMAEVQRRRMLEDALKWTFANQQP